MASNQERSIIVTDDITEATISGATVEQLTQERKIQPHRIIYARSAADLEQKKKAGKLDRADLLIIDLDLPDRTEVDSLNAIAQLKLGIPIIAVTPSLLDITEEDLKDKGVKKLLVKPIDITEFRTAILESLNSPKSV